MDTLKLTKYLLIVVITSFSYTTYTAPLNEAPLLIGKVFHDRNADGIQNTTEEGIPGVRLATVTGLVAETDGYGRFHINHQIKSIKPIKNSLGRHFILKVDKASLPNGAFLTTENPRVIHGSQMTLEKINFGIQY